MRLLLDQGLPRSAAGLLAAANIDAVHVADLGLSSAEDSGILDVARKEARIVVTLDADFHNQLAVSGSTSPSVIRIRIERLRGEELAVCQAGNVGKRSGRGRPGSTRRRRSPGNSGLTEH
jgi:predicted nuclease of predicted toxin-antitoxin system